MKSNMQKCKWSNVVMRQHAAASQHLAFTFLNFKFSDFHPLEPEFPFKF